MYYKLTLLKDLPKYPSGTQFDLSESIRLCGKKSDVIKRKEYYMRLYIPHDTDYKQVCALENKNKDYMFLNRLLIPLDVINNSEWVKKEVNYARYTDLRCPICGSTKHLIHVIAYEAGNRDDGYYNTADITLECSCGHIFNIYTGD